MATRKQKKTVKVRDLKPSKDAKGGAVRVLSAKNASAKLIARPNVVHN